MSDKEFEANQDDVKRSDYPPQQRLPDPDQHQTIQGAKPIPPPWARLEGFTPPEQPKAEPPTDSGK